MTTDEQYVPSEKAVRRAYTYYYDPATIRRSDTEQEFDRFLARVRRDAARDALDGLARESMGAFKSPLAPPDPRSWAEMAGAVEWYRDAHYPEETP